MVKLNLGAGGVEVPGFQSIDRKNGQEAYPLDYEDGSVEEIRASHVLEHFDHRDVPKVVSEWARVLSPGGVLRIAVPDFDKIVEWYKADRQDIDLQAYLMGGQVDGNDYHKAIFNEETLRGLLEEAGLVDIKPWQSEVKDCAALEVSLNLQGTKPGAFKRFQPRVVESEDLGPPIKIAAIASVPRLGFNATWDRVNIALFTLGIPLATTHGVFWDQCLSRGIEQILKDQNPDYVLVLDYDSVFSTAHLARLCQLMIENPQFDAICPVQMKREENAALFKLPQESAGEVIRIGSGHFGLTLFKSQVFRRVPKPWFHSQPNDQGEWGEKRIDADIWFWRQFAIAGCVVGLAREVKIGHLELMVTWPNDEMGATHQRLTDFWANGQPVECGGGLKTKLIA